MTRPLYETDGDRDNEAAIADFIINNTKMTMLEPQAPQSTFDYIGGDGKAVYNIEIKRRYIEWGVYSTILLSAEKYMAGLRCHARDGVEFVFIVQANDRLMYHKATPESLIHIKNGWGGREDRGDKLDMEWVVHIPIKLFIELADYDVTKEKADKVPEDTGCSDGEELHY